MAFLSNSTGAFSLKAYRGDAKTLLAFNLTTPASRKKLAGFTIQVLPPGAGQVPYFLQNNLRFEKPENHAQATAETPFSSINAPIHKFRWVHVPGLNHQGLTPPFGLYTYTVTPRYFDAAKKLLPLDPTLSAAVQIQVAPFVKGKVAVGFTRGFTQSQAFVQHFGAKAKFKPKVAGLTFDTTLQAGVNDAGEPYTWEQMYAWSGFTARKLIFDLLAEVEGDPNLVLDVFAYDLNEPDFIAALLKLSDRTRIILDDATLHHAADGSEPEDKFAAAFDLAKSHRGQLVRGNFGRYSHDKVLLVSDQTGPKKVLTGSTNFSVTGVYVNSNHVLVFDDRKVAEAYAKVFEKALTSVNQGKAFQTDPLAATAVRFNTAAVADTTITFSPHTPAKATEILAGLIARVAAEGQAQGRKGNVLFAVMELDAGRAKPGQPPPNNPVYTALNAIHARTDVFSYGISDNPEGISLYPAGATTGVLVTGKPVGTQLPKPFSQVPGMGGGHQVHHKFVVCGFNSPDATTYCGSSNLALTGEQVNGDNLLAIRDQDIAVVFTIEALALVDHFDFLNRAAKPKPAAAPAGQPGPVAAEPEADKQKAAVAAGWFLGVTDAWATKYFDPNDLHSVDRELFA